MSEAQDKLEMDDDVIDLAVVDGIIDRHKSSANAAIAILQGIQARFRYLPREALRRVCERTGIRPAQIAGVSTFYSQFRHKPVGKHLVRVCHGTACHVVGAPLITDTLRRHLSIPEDTDTDAKRLFTVEQVPCLGCCSLAPCMTVDDVTYGHLSVHTVCRIVDRIAKGHVDE